MKIPSNPYLLLTPGPLSTSRSVRAEMLRDWCTWDDDYNVGVVQKIRQRLVTLSGGGDYTAVLMQGSGTFSVEAAIGSSIPHDGKLLVVVNGAYGQRIATIAKMLCIPVTILNGGEHWQPSGAEITAALDNDKKISHVATVHVETTTGMINPVAEICAAAKAAGKVVIIDAMSSFGGIPMDIAGMQADFIVSSANKCVQGVPGFGFIIAHREALLSVKGFARSHSLDMYEQWQTMEKGSGKWRFTSPTHTVRAFLCALDELDEEGGIDARHMRYSENHRILVDGMRELGFATFLPDAHQSPIITAFLNPDSPRYEFKRFYTTLKESGLSFIRARLPMQALFASAISAMFFPLICAVCWMLLPAQSTGRINANSPKAASVAVKVGYDLAVIGAGIAGLAHAYAAARRGWRVVVCERDSKARGASIRNFGMILPLGMPPGICHQYALAGRETWLRLAHDADFWIKECGTLIPAYRQDELTVMDEFAARGPALGYAVEMLDTRGVHKKCSALCTNGLCGGLFSFSDMGVDARQAIASITRHLREDYGVTFRYHSPVLRVEPPRITIAPNETVHAECCVVCPGADLTALFPDVFRAASVRRCKLQMIRTPPQPEGLEISPHIASALSLLHYESFSDCPSLIPLRERMAAEMPELNEFGIHILIAQNELGEVLIGDSHEYGNDHPIGLSPHIESLMIHYAKQMLVLPDFNVASRWSGVYAKPLHTADIVATPMERVWVVVGAGGAGMTLSFALAEEVCAKIAA